MSYQLFIQSNYKQSNSDSNLIISLKILKLIFLEKQKSLDWFYQINYKKLTTQNYLVFQKKKMFKYLINLMLQNLQPLNLPVNQAIADYEMKMVCQTEKIRKRISTINKFLRIKQFVIITSEKIRVLKQIQKKHLNFILQILNYIALQAEIFEAQGKYEEAEQFLNKFHKDILNDPVILDANGKVYLYQLKYTQAEAVFKQIKGVEAQLGYAQSCLKQKKYTEAIKEYQQILQQNPKNLNALNSLAKIQFDKVFQQQKTDTIALKLEQQNKDGKQEQHLNEVIRICEIVTKSSNPFKRAVNFNRLRKCQKKYDKALDAFINSVAAESKFVFAWSNRAQVELQIDKSGESLTSLMGLKIAQINRGCKSRQIRQQISQQFYIIARDSGCCITY
ncbi:unnamed protein product [Paramecium sonneborni]|uniref:Tetratricopeptide repeat protein n=1 Tax=Paramecium sonneborni TaxID=65129 RepID=A0A8S1NG77_9CILI|nr:unnamed protein product [Paramecium sonneborni]